MKYILSIFALATLVAIPPAQAQQRPYREGRAPVVVQPLAVGDPQKLIYRIAGIRDSGDEEGVGVATAFHCTSFSTVVENLRFVIRNHVATVVGNLTTPIASNTTDTFITHPAFLFIQDHNLSTGAIAQGSAVIFATAPEKVFCSAMIVDAASAAPQGIALHMVRFNPITNTQE